MPVALPEGLLLRTNDEGQRQRISEPEPFP